MDLSDFLPAVILRREGGAWVVTVLDKVHFFLLLPEKSPRCAPPSARPGAIPSHPGGHTRAQLTKSMTADWSHNILPW